MVALEGLTDCVAHDWYQWLQLLYPLAQLPQEGQPPPCQEYREGLQFLLGLRTKPLGEAIGHIIRSRLR
jgi:hypothetical protein